MKRMVLLINGVWFRFISKWKRRVRMMKNLLFILIVIFSMGMVLLLTSCDDIKRTDKLSQNNQIDHHVVEKDNGVNVTMKALYNDDKMTIVLDNNGSQSLHFGTPYYVEKQKNDKWYQTEFTYEKGFNDIDITLKSGKKYTQKVELTMPDGHYRVIKQLSSAPLGDDDITIGDTFTVGD
ncbi:hypothetical protein GCM10008983_13540 [Lentibacillus halophilus]|uniref:Bacterial Ig-like domain-containing protein n=1 Tax=Lentibacillus halophilus TaxID=295065 RepID=A0ABP3J1Z9_9BACI